MAAVADVSLDLRYADWRATENNRRGKYYALTPQGRATLKRETKDWEQQTAAIARILAASLGDL